MKEKLINYLNSAYAPYSNYQVSACVVMKDGSTFYGVNVENISYGATICAERNAINQAISLGYRKGDFKSLYVMTNNELSFPCFLCRQTLSEFFNGDEELVLMNKEEEVSYKISDIVVKPFVSSEV